MIVTIALLGFLVGMARAQCLNQKPSCVEEGTECSGASLCYFDFGACVRPAGELDAICHRDPAGLSCYTEGDAACQSSVNGVDYTCTNRTGGPALTCQYKEYPGYHNDGCDEDDDCYGGLPCVGGLCLGRAQGELCNDDNECQNDQYCDDVCRPSRVTLHEECSDSDECKDYADTCTYSKDGIDRCVGYDSVDEGEPCGSDFVCKDGLYCGGYDSRCHKIPSDVAGRACSDATDCNGGESTSCTCDLFDVTGGEVCQVNPQDNHGKIRAYAACLQSHDCHRSTEASYARSCAQMHCGSEIRALIANGVQQARRMSLKGAPEACYDWISSPASILPTIF